VVLMDDRRRSSPPLPVPDRLVPVTTVVQGREAGPAAARNLGWRAARYSWVVLLDDDVVPEPDCFARLADDLAMDPPVGGVQGQGTERLRHRRPTDWERSTAGLATGGWIIADMASRLSVLAAVCGFDDRFPRDYREDVELASRVQQAGWRL